MCESSEDMLRLLVCDECSFYCCHTYCCNPPLKRIPVDPWYCQFCKPIEIPTPKINANTRNNNLGKDSVVSRSIRNSLNENSILHKLFEKADKKIEDEIFGKSSQQLKTNKSSSKLRGRDFKVSNNTKRKESSTKKNERSFSKKTLTKKPKSKSRERSRSKSAVGIIRMKRKTSQKGKKNKIS